LFAVIDVIDKDTSIYIKIVRLIRNVGDASYAMSHLSAVGSGCMRRPDRVP